MTRESIEHYQKLTNYKKELPFYLRLGLYRGEAQRQALTVLINDSWLSSVINPVNRVLQIKLKKYFYKWQHANSKQRMLLRGDYYTTLKAYMMMAYPSYMSVDFSSIIITPLWYKELFKRDPRSDNQQSGSYLKFC